jgi:hypothetical protein
MSPEIKGQVKTTIEKDLQALRDKLSKAIADDARKVAEARARAKANKASLSKHDPKPPAPVKITIRERPWQTRFKHGPKYYVLSAIDTLKRPQFTGNDVFTQIEQQFPDSGVTRAHVSSLLWKLSSSPKHRVDSFRKVSVSKGGKIESKYEKIGPITRNGTEPH